MSLKDKRVAELEGSEKKLSQDLSQAKLITEGSYTLGFDTTVDQVKYFFIDKDLNLGLLDLTKYLSNIIG